MFKPFHRWVEQESARKVPYLKAMLLQNPGGIIRPLPDKTVRPDFSITRKFSTRYADCLCAQDATVCFGKNQFDGYGFSIGIVSGNPIPSRAGLMGSEPGESTRASCFFVSKGVV